MCCRIVTLTPTINTVGYCSSCSSLKNKNHYIENKLLPLWYDNDIPQFHVPPVLECLSHAEKMLIQRVSPFVPLHHIKHGIFGLSGHVCAFEQDIGAMVDILPRFCTETGVIRVLQEVRTEIGSDTAKRTKAFKVNKGRVLAALSFLKEHNREYYDITIDSSRLDWIDGDEGDLEGQAFVVDELKTNKDNTPENSDMGPAIHQCVHPRNCGDDVQAYGYIPDGGIGALSPDDQVINQALQEAVKTSPSKKNIHMDWPEVAEIPVNEYSNIRIFARAFPWLFPGGYGDIKDYSNPEKAAASWGKRLLYYEDGRFAKDKLFCFFAMNYIIRHRNSTSGKFFIEKFQRNVPDTLDELKDAMRNGNTSFVNHLTYYNKRIKGSSPYWFQKRSELYAWINQHIERGNGPPTFFITLSCAEYFWPDVIDLLRDRLKLAGKDSSRCYLGSPHLVQLVNDYSLVIQEYFQMRTVAWLESVGKTIFGIKHYWIRYEFAPGRGQIHAHLLAIPENHDIFELCHYDLQQPNGDAIRAKRLAEWAETTFGLTASVDDDFDNRNPKGTLSPVSIRFSDIQDNDEAIMNDTYNLMHYCELHDCSQFCMRTGNDKQ